jgi:hypothetical protein
VTFKKIIKKIERAAIIEYRIVTTVEWPNETGTIAENNTMKTMVNRQAIVNLPLSSNFRISEVSGVNNFIALKIRNS